jgi:ribosomal protein S27AE
MINAKCPNCGEWLSVPASLAGSTEQCPNCGANVHLPDPNAISDQLPPHTDQHTGAPEEGKGLRNAGRTILLAAILVFLHGGISFAFGVRSWGQTEQRVDEMNREGHSELARKILDERIDESKENDRWRNTLFLLGGLLGIAGSGLYSHGESKRGRKATWKGLFSSD